MVIVGIVLVALGFFGGMQYGKGVSGTASLLQQRTGQGGGNFGMGQRGSIGQNADFAGGQIIAKDDKGITVKLRDGSSKIVFISGATPVMKSVDGSVSDLTIGEQVTVQGSANSDGSITAQSVQIRQESKTNQQ